MLQQTAARLDDVADLASDCIVVCNEAHRFLVAQQLKEIDCNARILLEPSGRNTAPAIAIAAYLAKTAGDESSTLLVLPADQVISNKAALHAAIEQGREACDHGSIVTFGIVPQSPHTGFGYIKASTNGENAVPVESFVEKPDARTAADYLASGNYLWNSGMFMFRTDRYLEELEKHAPEIAAACQAAMQAASADSDFIRPGNEEFLACPADSIDYAVMERTDQAMVVPLDAGWSDLGSFAALYDVSVTDDDGNAISGDVVACRSSGNLISSESRLVAAVGVSDLAIVETKDAVLVTDKSHSQEVKQLVDVLKSMDRPETSLHRQVFRPWGSYDSLENEDGFQVKHLIVNPGAVLSLQMHHRRAEHWVVVQGTATITLNDDEFDLTVNESTYIPIGAKHRIANQTDEPVHIIEVQCGDYLGEDDIVRFEDNYGREGTNT